ncbi:MAG TPA: bifunctional precorrin-2 dehydrogenase/sirohydrochlorin ferrochelatase [Terriglobales bacterium]|nr:bifunctional precorrin-2 dehydrogenase/sirohydrochlorin ferrochelatase [Terriglobales bacterium]
MPTLFPIFLKLNKRRVLVVGAGNMGESKIAGLLDTGALIKVVARHASDAVSNWAANALIELELRGFATSDLEGAFLVVVATTSPVLNELIFSEAQRRQILCNVVDLPDECDFFYPAVVRRGDLQIAISTSGQSPSLAQRIRRRLEKQFGPAYGGWVKELGETRREILKSDLSPEQKRELLRSLANRSAFEAMVARASLAKEGVA